MGLRYSVSYRGTSLKRNSLPLGPYSRTLPGALDGGGLFLMSEAPLPGGRSIHLWAIQQIAL